MNPLQLVLVFFQLAQQKARAYTDAALQKSESTDNKVKSLDNWTVGKNTEAYPSADAVVSALEKSKMQSFNVAKRTMSFSVNNVLGRTLSFTTKEEK